MPSMGYILRALLLLSALWGSLAMAQSTNVGTALARVNDQLAAELRFTCDDEQELTIIQSNAYGVVQKDHLSAAQIDAAAIQWDAQGDLLLPCSSQHKHCVQSINFRLDQERRSSILRLPVALNGTAREEFAAALRDLLHAFAEENELVVTYPPLERMTTNYLNHDL